MITDRNRLENGCAIVLFVYNRPTHTEQTLISLKENLLADQHDLFIYSDGMKSDQDSIAVNAVRNLARSVTGFRKVVLIERERNMGLADNIISGLNDIAIDYTRFIVLEDDIITSPLFLSYMNDALERYQAEKSVWHISGWNYPIETEGLQDAFFCQAMECWGWGTWSDRWVHFQRDPEAMVKTWSRKERYFFNLEGSHNLWKQVRDNYRGKRRTWAIFWYATIFKQGGLCLNPSRSLTKNVGHDGSGANCRPTDIYNTDLALEFKGEWPEEISLNPVAHQRIRQFSLENDPPLFRACLNYGADYLRKLFGNLKKE